MGKTKSKGDHLQQKSPAEFFAENKNIAGFDNPGRCLYTTVRELVENSLDAAESIKQLPSLEVTIEEISQERLNKLRGVANVKRVDQTLYGDYESEDARKKREAKEAKEMEKLEKQIAKSGETAVTIAKRKELEAKSAAAVSGKGSVFYKVTVKDNGMGMSHADIPNMFGCALSGTKYGVKQTRGKFGLGAKMALIWAKMSTGLPIDVTSAQYRSNTGKGTSQKSFYRLDIDIQRNEPNIYKEQLLPNPQGWFGAEFKFQYIAENEGSNSVTVEFSRRTEQMPPVPKATTHHPSSVDLELIKRLIQDTKYHTMLKFLHKEFSVIDKGYAGRLVAELRGGVDEDTNPQELTPQQVARLHQLLQEARFKDPDGGHLSPAGEYNLRLGILKEIQPDMVATYQGDVRVFEGHAFVVEAGVSIGGRDIKPGINVYRFANRIPLLFEGGSDVITKTALKRINWGSYKINPSSDKVGVFVSLVSTKIPFKGAGKEYIADDIEEIHQAVKQAIQQCCVQLKGKIAKQHAAREQKQRKKNLVKYIPNVASAVFTVLEKMAGTEARGVKRRRLESLHTILPSVQQEQVSEDTLVQRLHEHVDRIDTDMALEYQMQQGIAEGAKDTVYLAPKAGYHVHGPEIHSNVVVVRVLRGV